MNRRIFPILAIAAAIICLYQAPSAYADCTSPEGAESQTNYDFTNHVLRYCDGTNWLAMGEGHSGGGKFVDGTNANDAAYMTGNVGIGTMSPTHSLDIVANASEAAELRLRSSEAGGDALNLVVQVDEDNDFVHFDISGNNSAFDRFHFGDLTASANAITTLGNVGIGTTEPNAALHIMPSGSDAAGTRINGFSTSSDIDALLNGSTFGSLWEGGFQGHTVVGIRDNDVGDTFSIVSGGGNWNTDSTYDTVIMSATANGNVGIGTTVPARQLELEGSNAVIRLTDTSSGAAANGFLEIYGANGSRTGYVGDGSISNSHIYILSEDGNVYASGIGGGCYVNSGGCTSDARLKDEIEDYSKGSLLKITKLRGVTYEWKDTPGKRHVGFLAQEVQQYFPDLVEEGDDGYLTVNYRNMVVPLVEAAKELKAANDNLRSEHAAQLKSLTERIEKLEAAAQ